MSGFLAIVASVSLAAPAQPQEAGGITAKWAEDSRWTGYAKHQSDEGGESSADVTLTVTKRDGKSFEGRYEADAGGYVLEVKGSVTATRVSFRVTKVLSSKQDLKNIVGLQVGGQVRRKPKSKETVLDASYNWPSADKVGIVRRGKLVLTLEE